MEVIISLAIITLLFGLYALFLKNDYYKQFFFLLSLLMVIVTIMSPSFVSYEKVCNEITNQTCVNETATVLVNPGFSNALVYGFGLVIILFLSLILLSIIIDALKGI